jgi:diguanylate cyclase (GGDEF)-like protein
VPVTRASPARGQPRVQTLALAAVLVLDLDRFREVGERFGDDAVDRLLIAVAGRLRSILRPSDSVARFGSDEFAVLCPDPAHERDAVRLAERVTAGLATPFAVGGQESASATPSA